MTATCFVQPLDLVKTRMQMSGKWKKVSLFSDYFYKNWLLLAIVEMLHQPVVLNVILLQTLNVILLLLHCVVLHCIVLHCIALYCIVLYCIVLYCIVLHLIVLYCIVLYCILLHWSKLFQMIVSLTGVGGATKTHKTSFHAVYNIIRAEGVLGVYNG